MPEASEAVTLSQLAGWCETHERVLRWQYPEGALPVAWEAELASVPADTAQNAVQRLALLKHFYRLDHEKREAKHAPPEPEEAQAAAYSLLRREPVYVTLANGREIAVTDRSLSALTEIAAHQIRVKLLDAEINALAAMFGRLSPRTIRQRLNRHRRRMLARIADLHQRAYTERERHRAQMYAHIFTDSGAPAGPTDSPPAWWREITTEDDGAILAALVEAGPLRARRLGQRPESKKGKKSEPTEDWGYEGVMVAWGIRKKVEPARALDQGLGQAIAEMRLAAPPTLAEEIDGG